MMNMANAIDRNATLVIDNEVDFGKFTVKFDILQNPG